MKKDEPIIQSRVDTDLYKLTMGKAIHKFHPSVASTFGLTNRTVSVPLAKIIDEGELREQLDHVRILRPTNEEIVHLRGQGLFDEEYLGFFQSLQLGGYDLEKRGDQYRLEFSGSWEEETHWEIPSLSIIAQLYARSQMQDLSQTEKDRIIAIGKERLEEKIKIILAHPHISFIDFGGRRRASRAWHDYVVQRLAEALPREQFLGTSNVFLAKKHGVPLKGTFAHELLMGYSALFEDLHTSQREALNMWGGLYGELLSIALPDTYGSPYFFREIFAEFARVWRGTRQDSGDPIAYGEMVIAFYKSLGIDPRDKLIVFSDGLTIQEIIRIADHFRGRIRVTFGWGTNLTNDLGLKVLSIVIKLIMANGKYLVKLSDNIAKAIGPAEEIERTRIITKYDTAFYQECRC